MLIKKGTLLKVNHMRIGTFTALAGLDFDTNEIWWSLTVPKNSKPIRGPHTTWYPGTEIDFRGTSCKFKIID